MMRIAPGKKPALETVSKRDKIWMRLLCLLEKTKKNSDSAELAKVVDQTSADNNDTPDEHDCSHVLRRLGEFVENHVARNLGENVYSCQLILLLGSRYQLTRDKVDGKSNIVLFSVHLEIR